MQEARAHVADETRPVERHSSVRAELVESLLERSLDLVYRFRLKEPMGFEYVSPSASRITGYSPKEHYADPLLGMKLVHPDDRHLLERAMAGTTDEPLLLRWLTKDGRTIWTEQHNVLVRDSDGSPLAIEGVARDVTEREEILARLKHSEARYRSLVSTMAEGVVFHDAEGRIEVSNPAAERILGLSFDQMRGLTSLDPRWQAVREDGSPFPGEEHPAVVTRVTGRPVFGEVMGVRRADGTTVWVLVNAQPLALGPREPRAGVVVSFSDISAQREANQRLRSALDANERLVAELREALGRVRTLSGLLPICANCKKIRVDTGYWERIERYISDHTDAEFTHGICPDCAAELYPGLGLGDSSDSQPPSAAHEETEEHQSETLPSHSRQSSR